MNKELLRFLITVTIGLVLVFGLHLLVLYIIKHPLFDESILLSYIVNFILAAIIFTVIILLKEKFKTSIGFIFMGGSLLKFAVFFIVFAPIFKADGNVNSFEFASFFIPYLTCLIIETIQLTNLLNKS